MKKLVAKDRSLVFANRQELRNVAPNQQITRALGIVITAPYLNKGANGVTCDLQTDSIELHVTSSVCWPKIGDINTKAVEAHENMLKRLDVAMEELQAHKQRLLADKVKLESKEIDLDTLAKQQWESE